MEDMGKELYTKMNDLENKVELKLERDDLENMQGLINVSPRLPSNKSNNDQKE
jgi:hypothetical protein